MVCNGTSISDTTNLVANTTYTYIVTPYNAVDVSGQPYTLIAKTLPKINTFNTGLSTTSKIQLVFTGSYDYVNMLRNGESLVTQLVDVSYSDSVAMNTLYTYTIIPFSYSITNGVVDINGTPVSGTPISIPAYTSPSISQSTSNTYVSDLGTNTLTLNYKNGAFGYVLISRNGTLLANTKSLGSTNSYTDMTGLTANTAYTYVITPYNLLDSAGASVTLNTMTLPSFTVASATNITTTSIKILFNDTKNVYSYVTIRRTGTVTGTVNGTGTVTDIVPSSAKYSDTSYSDTGITPGLSCTYVITPYNSFDTSGTPYTIVTSTLPAIGNISTAVTAIDSTTSSGLIFTMNNSYYTYVDISRNDGKIAKNVVGYTWTDSPLLPNNKYIYRIIPYNALNVSGGLVDISYTALPILTSLRTGTTGTNSIKLLFEGLSSNLYDHVSIVRNGTTTLTSSLSDISYTDTSLSPNVLYSYVVTPYTNASIGSVAGTPWTIASTTQPTLTDTNFVYVGYNRIILGFAGAFTKINIIRTDLTTQDSVTFYDITSSLYSDTTVTSNTSYSYRVVPYSVSGIAGTATTLNATTLSSVDISTGIVTGNSIQLLFKGTYSYLNGLNATNSTSFAYLQDSAYTFTGLTGNTAHNFTIYSYNSMGTLGQYQTYSVYTLPSATSAVITKYDSSSVSLSYNGQYTSVGIVRNDVQVALISGSNVTNTTYTDYSGVLGNTLYNYGVIPYNANIPPLAGAQINVSNNPITTLANLVPSLGKTTANSIQVMFGGQYSYVYVYLNGVYDYE